jgi:GNAT superfamily N-acetyltransferase
VADFEASFQSDGFSYRVSKPKPRELPAAFVFLPHMLGQSVPLEGVYAAACAETSQVVGAAAFSLAPFGLSPSGLRIDIFVSPDHRNRGVGYCLLQALAFELKRWNVKYLYSWEPPKEADAQTRLVRWGFKAASELLCFEIEGAKCIPMLEKKSDASNRKRTLGTP